MGRKKGAKGPAREQEIFERAEWIADRLREYGEGVHLLGAPAVVLDSALPAALDAVYREFDGGELFHQSVNLLPGAQIRGSEGRVLVGEYGGDAIYLDTEGAVWRLDGDTEELLPEGTSFDRWLAGVVDAEALLYDREGEFVDELFDEDGELRDSVVETRERRQIKRDPRAIAPRWRLARALFHQDKLDIARDELEKVVEAAPDFAWAWFDLARISERLGDPDTASEEAEQAAEAKPGYAHAGYFLGHAARLAELADQKERSQKLAARALSVDPDLVRRHREGARHELEEGNSESARELLLVAKVVAPRDLEVLDLLRRIES